MKIDRSILQANDQNIGDFGDPDKIESSINHLANVIDENDNGFNAHKTATELDHPDKSVTEKKLGDSSVSSRTVQAGAIGTRELDPSLFSQPTTVQGVQVKFQSIDEQLLETMNKTSWINPDDFTGTDAEKLQQAIDKSISDNIPSTIILNRIYDVTGATLYINKTFDNKIMTKILGIGGGLRKNDAGFMFDSTSPLAGNTIQSGNVVLSHLEFKSVANTGTKLINGDKFYCVYSSYNRYDGVDCLVYGDTNYLQSFHFFECHVYGGNGTVIDYKNCFDFTWDSCSINDYAKNGIICQSSAAIVGNPNPSGSGNNNLRIVNSTFQGMTGKAIQTGFSSVGQIRGNYFELNAEYIDVSLTPSYALEIANNFFHDTNTSKVAIYWPTVAVGGRGDQDKYVSIANLARMGINLHGFKSAPQSGVKIYSIGDVGTIYNYPDSIVRIGQKTTSTIAVGTDNTNVRELNGLKYIDTMRYVVFNASETKIVNVDMGLTMDKYKDFIQVSLIGDSDTDSSFTNFELLNIYAINNILKVKIKNTYAGTAGCRICIRAMQIS